MKLEVPVPSEVFEFAVVGLEEVLQHTPFAVIADPPSVIVDPPELAVVCPIVFTATVVPTVGPTGPDVKVT